MQWKKLGKIFDPRDFELPNGCLEFSQSPQALAFDDFVRIYFSTRTLDTKSRKYLSHIAYVDFSDDLKRALRVSEHQVIPLGELGTFDEHGIFPINVLRHRGRMLAYTCGWSRRISVSVETGVGLAVSEDNGHTFNKIGCGPVLTASLHEPCLVGDAFVRVYDDLFHMWYIFGKGWKHGAPEVPADRIYKIGHATSHDGLHWQKDEGHQIISDVLGNDECQALPTVIKIGVRYHMFFCFREHFNFRSAAGRGYRIGHASSSDLVRWERHDNEIPFAGKDEQWDSDMQCYPNVFEWNGKLHMLYNGNEFGRHGFGIAELQM